MAAILLSRMKASHCSTGFFCRLSPPSNFHKRELPFLHGLDIGAYKLLHDESGGNSKNHTEWSHKIRRYNNSCPYVMGNLAAPP